MLAYTEQSSASSGGYSITQGLHAHFYSQTYEECGQVVHCVMYCVCVMYCDLTTRYMWSGDMWEGGEGRQVLSQTLHSVPWPKGGSDKML